MEKHFNTSAVSFLTKPLDTSNVEESLRSRNFLSNFGAKAEYDAISKINTKSRLIPEVKVRHTPYEIEFGEEKDKDGFFNINGILRSHWTPDGSAFYIVTEDTFIRLYSLPEDFEHFDKEMPILRKKSLFTNHCGTEIMRTTCLHPWCERSNGDIILDCCWFPVFDWSSEKSSCLAVSSLLSPIHLYSAYDLRILSSYKCKNKADEIDSSYSLAFEPRGHQLVAGGVGRLNIFAIERPGSQLMEINLSRQKSSKFGKKGIVSCLDIANKQHVTAYLYACGSYNATLITLDTRSSDFVAQRFTDASHSIGGLIQVRFCDNTNLISGHRQDGFIRCWDIRNTNQPLFRFSRHTFSNHKFYFDTLQSILVSGDEKRRLHFYDILSGSCIKTESDLFCNSITNPSFHPSKPLLLTASSERVHYDLSFISDSFKGTLDTATSGSEANNYFREGVYSDYHEYNSRRSLKGNSFHYHNQRTSVKENDCNSSFGLQIRGISSAKLWSLVYGY